MTIYKNDNANEVFMRNDFNSYDIIRGNDPIAELHFQQGKIGEDDSIDGITDEDVLYIVKNRLESFQKKNRGSVENEMAIEYIAKAIDWMESKNKKKIK